MNIEKKLRLGNQEFVQNIDQSNERKTLVKKLSSGQSPFALVITCSDSRVIPEEIFSCSLGDLFVIRTAGNVVNEGELASIEYGVEHLHIKYIIVLAHTHCGAVHAAIHNEQGKYLSPVVNGIKAAINDEKDEMKASIKNATAQVAFIKDKFPKFDGEVRCALYDIETGEVIF